MSIYVKR